MPNIINMTSAGILNNAGSFWQWLTGAQPLVYIIVIGVLTVLAVAFLLFALFRKPKRKKDVNVLVFEGNDEKSVRAEVFKPDYTMLLVTENSGAHAETLKADEQDIRAEEEFIVKDKFAESAAEYSVCREDKSENQAGATDGAESDGGGESADDTLVVNEDTVEIPFADTDDAAEIEEIDELSRDYESVDESEYNEEIVNDYAEDYTAVIDTAPDNSNIAAPVTIEAEIQETLEVIEERDEDINDSDEYSAVCDDNEVHKDNLEASTARFDSVSGVIEYRNTTDSDNGRACAKADVVSNTQIIDGDNGDCVEIFDYSDLFETDDTCVEKRVTPKEPSADIECESQECRTIEESSDIVITEETEIIDGAEEAETESEPVSEESIASDYAEDDYETEDVDTEGASDLEREAASAEVVDEVAVVDITEPIKIVESESADSADDREIDAVFVDKNILKARYKTVDLETRLRRADENTKVYYSELKNLLLSYQGVKSRVSKKFDTFTIGRFIVAKMAVRGNVINLYLALASESLEGKYFAEDVGDSETYGKTPTLHKVKSRRGCKYGVELIRDIMNELQIPSLTGFERIDYAAIYPKENIEEKKNEIRHMFRSSIDLEAASGLLTDEESLEYLEIVKNKSYTINKFMPINKYVLFVDDIDELYNDGDTVTIADLKSKEILPDEDNIFLEIRARGELNKKLTVEAHSFDPNAIKMIILTDGNATQYK